MRSHGVTCHPTQVNAPRASKLVLDLPTPERVRRPNQYTTDCCRIVRDRGIYGTAAVQYRITESQNVTIVPASDMFVYVSGLVMFADRQFNAELTVNVLHTGIPHFDLHYVIQLLNVTGMIAFVSS